MRSHTYQPFDAEPAVGPGAAELEAAWTLEEQPGHHSSRLVSLYLRAAELGQVSAMVNLGAMLLNGDGVRRSRRAALHWYRRAWERTKDPVAAFNLGLAFDPGVPRTQRHGRADRARARTWYRRAAQRSFPSALQKLAWLIANARGDWHVELALLLNGHRRGQLSPVSEYNLALALEFGHGVKKNVDLAMRLYRHAARRGDADAQVALAFNTLNGIGVRASTATARRWYELAATQAHVSALFSLGEMLLEHEPRRARAYWRRAASLGHQRAREALAHAS